MADDDAAKYNSVRHAVNQLLGGEPTMNATTLAEEAQCAVSDVYKFWRSMGFPIKDLAQPTFTDNDREALEEWIDLVDSRELLAEDSAHSLIRAQSQHMDRLVLWQFEALVQDLIERRGLDDTSARLVLVDRINDYQSLLEDQLIYAWRRHMAALLMLTNREVGQRGQEQDDPNAYPLDRCMGFVDMVAYTRSSAVMGSHELAELIENFEMTCRAVITDLGGRVVKTIGDAVMYVASDLRQAADIACGLIEQCNNNPDLLPVRASMVHGHIVSRSGDIFGPPVNLAARIADIAPTGNVFVDEETAKDIQALPYDPTARQFAVVARGEANLQGFGPVSMYRLYRADA